PIDIEYSNYTVEVEEPRQNAREQLQAPGIGERLVLPLARRAKRRVGKGTEHQVLQTAVAHNAPRIRSTLRSRVSAVSEGEKASKVTALARGHRLTASARKSSISTEGSAGAIHGPCRSASCSTPATCSSTTCSSGNSATHAA